MTAKKRKRLYLIEWMEFLELSKSDISRDAPVSRSTLDRILEGGPYYTSTLRKIAQNALKIEYADLWKPPYERQDKDRPPPGKEDDECIDLNTLVDDPNLVDRGQPLTEEQKKLLRSMIEVIRRSR